MFRGATDIITVRHIHTPDSPYDINGFSNLKSNRMTRQPHDQLAKEYLEELLYPLGKVETSRDVRSEIQEIDVWFVPATPPVTNPPNLGLLSQMVATSCLIEPYRNAPTEIEIRSCLLKLYTVHGELLQKAKREKQSLA